ncbi:conserved Plasmodium protein, unknown function [Plasmodium berghei]|uniref:Uncharacterized protein n=2 Tax=Plasmodium berghei TaxID=5821 RepID=A0A509AK72_PLABA|nr:conserved protein, unknown function [Plasmodium berghei ANKA]CXI43323.1 conserved Plasmodium protein, unknown function [Plasmodium berghei]SCM22292.1 conserved Plasmodium protein, unknown function [Plasmodium berghei]SCN25376.1 conserved Plasmodium protein, unknown function [Plasmodium berghei]SCO60345.1 conserved Plasmodium protein, unknown function [Plasmodium berghei]SCO62071.1 conserved Plasmodium protein, unknown function [Plasmodium berghei]|eukprot:XP_034421590.1 conserved protein, unknown function [Plasmodium berghei ANKA]
MNGKNNNELETNSNDNEARGRDVNLDENKDTIYSENETNNNIEQKNVEEKKESSSLFSKYYSKLVNINDNTKDNDTTFNHENKESTYYTFNKNNENSENNENEYISKDINLDEENISKDHFNESLQNIINFNKKNVDLDLCRGEIYLTNNELFYISYLVMNNHFRFSPIEDQKKKKKRDIVNSEELIIDSKRKKSDNTNDYYKIDDKSEIDLLKLSQENNSVHEKEDELTGNGGMYDNDSNSWSNKYSEHEISFKKKQQIDICNEILNHLQSKYYEQILNIENNFKNLENKIEDNNFFNFNCIMEKLRNKKYDNILLIFDDIHMYLNNLLFLSKPSSYIWMKLHELLNQVANTLLNIHQMKREAFNEIDYNFQDDNNEKKDIIGSQTIEQSINEEEKLSFQLLLGKLHQDIHFELFRKFKSKAVWKTLESGEIELDDKLTKADVFREMYNWCKLQLDLKDKRSEISESESDSSKDSY